MATQAVPSLLDEVLDFLASAPTPEEIIEARPSEAAQLHISDLLDRNREGRLTSEEKAELDEYLQVNHFMSLLKARARKKLQQK